MKEAIILVGGLGTRLKSVSGDTPKPLVSVSGKPFIYHLLDRLVESNISHIVLAVGYRYEMIMNQLGDNYKGIPVSYSIEEELLGTGGAIAQSLSFCSSDNVLVLNGDTYLDLDYNIFMKEHITSKKKITMALVEVENISRFGSVVVSDNSIRQFKEKKNSGSGFINAGVYCISNSLDLILGKYSFEDEILKKNVKHIHPFLTHEYFIDIGVPDDYHRANVYFSE